MMKYLLLALAVFPVAYLLTGVVSASKGIAWGERFAIRLMPTMFEFGGLTTTAADAVLKEDYKGPVREQLNNASVILAVVERNSEDIVGRRAVIPLHVGRNSGVGARRENADLPVPGNQRYEDIFIPIRSNYARIELTGQTIAVMSKDRGAFIRALRPEMDGAVEDAQRDLSRQVWGTSDGRIAETGATTSSTTVVLDAPTIVQLGQLEEGFLIDIGTVATPTAVASGRSVTSVDYTAGTIVISGAAVTTTTAHSIFRSGAGGASDNSGRINDGQVELTGLQHIVDDDSVLHTLDPATEPRWKAQVDDNGGTPRNISENLVTKQLMTSERKTGRPVSLLVGSDGVFRAYGNLLTSLKRVVNEMDLPGGYTGVTVGAPRQGRNRSATKLMLTWDRDAPSNALYGLDTENLVFMELEDWDWMDRDGAILNRVPNKDAYEATMFKYGDLACTRRNSQWRITAINEA